MISYLNVYQHMHSMSLLETLQVYTWEPLFLFFQWMVSRFSQDTNFYILSIFFFYSIILLWSLRQLFLPWQRVYVMFSYLMLPFFYAYVFNVTRQGFAMMVIILVLSYILKSNKIKIKHLLGLVISTLFHITSTIFSVALLLALKVRYRYILAFWILASALFLTGLNESILNFSFIYNLEQFREYTGSSVIDHYGSVNRKDFYVFGTFFLLISLFLHKKTPLSAEHKRNNVKLIKVYTAFNSIYLLLGFIAFSDRLAVYSWILIPILIMYPLLYSKKRSNLLCFLAVLFFVVFGFTELPFIAYK